MGYGSVTQKFRIPGSYLVGHFDHGKPDDLLAADKALLEYFYHSVFTHRLIVYVHHCVVTVGIKGLPQGGNDLHAQFGEHVMSTPLA